MVNGSRAGELPGLIRIDFSKHRKESYSVRSLTEELTVNGGMRDHVLESGQLVLCYIPNPADERADYETLRVALEHSSATYIPPASASDPHPVHDGLVEYILPSGGFLLGATRPLSQIRSWPVIHSVPVNSRQGLEYRIFMRHVQEETEGPELILETTEELLAQYVRSYVSD